MASSEDVDDPFMTVRQVSAYLNVSPNTLNYWRRTGRGPRGVRMGKILRYRRSAVEEWIQNCTEQDPRTRESVPDLPANDKRMRRDR